MALELRFSIEDELKIYARLLDQLMRKSSITITSTNQLNTISSNLRINNIDEYYHPINIQSQQMNSIVDSNEIHSMDSNRNNQQSKETIINLNSNQENEIEHHEIFDGCTIIQS